MRRSAGSGRRRRIRSRAFSSISAMTSRSPWASGDPMTSTNGSGPMGYGHDAKGAAGGDNKNDGRPNVAHTAPVDRVQGKAEGKPEAGASITFTLDGHEVE